MNHFNVSLAKSILRITACGFLIDASLVIAGGLLIAAEAMGILEEFVDKRKED